MNLTSSSTIADIVSQLDLCYFSDRGFGPYHPHQRVRLVKVIKSSYVFCPIIGARSSEKLTYLLKCFFRLWNRIILKKYVSYLSPLDEPGEVCRIPSGDVSSCNSTAVAYMHVATHLVQITLQQRIVNQYMSTGHVPTIVLVSVEFT